MTGVEQCTRPGTCPAGDGPCVRLLRGTGL